VEFKTGVVKVLPVPKELPPVAAAYQFVVDPAGGQTLFTAKFNVDEPQFEASTAVKLGALIVKTISCVWQPVTAV
jgi:hypothetical protein